MGVLGPTRHRRSLSSCPTGDGGPDRSLVCCSLSIMSSGRFDGSENFGDSALCTCPTWERTVIMRIYRVSVPYARIGAINRFCGGSINSRNRCQITTQLREIFQSVNVGSAAPSNQLSNTTLLQIVNEINAFALSRGEPFRQSVVSRLYARPQHRRLH